MLERTNIEVKLRAERGPLPEVNVLESLLRGSEIQWSREAGEPALKEAPARVNQFDFDLLETSRIYHVDHIRKICIDYRLRFLDLKYFKPELPEEALEALSEIEEVHQTRLKGLRIIAPSRLFKLADKDDPLLFAPMGNGYFYLVHKWGNDLHPLRKLLVWPFRNMVNLLLLILLASVLLTLMVPDGLFSKAGNQTQFWIIFFFIFKSVAAVVLYYGFAMGKNFNPAIWNSKYFNA
jgi:hypothetical protein